MKMPLNKINNSNCKAKYRQFIGKLTMTILTLTPSFQQKIIIRFTSNSNAPLPITHYHYKESYHKQSIAQRIPSPSKPYSRSVAKVRNGNKKDPDRKTYNRWRLLGNGIRGAVTIPCSCTNCTDSVCTGLKEKQTMMMIIIVIPKWGDCCCGLSCSGLRSSV